MSEDHPAGIPHSIAAFTRGDRSRAERLRQSLTRIRDEHPDPVVARGAGDVLSGRRTLRELVRDPRFAAAMGTATSEFADRWRELGPEERAALLEQARQAEGELRRRLGLPGRDE